MKITPLRILALLVLVIIPSTVSAGETVLIGGEKGNGDFEVGTFAKWSGDPGLIKDPESVTETARTGKYVYHVKFMGKPGERASASIVQNVSDVIPLDGKNFVVKLDTKSLADQMTPGMTVEMVLFDGNHGAAQVLLFAGEESYSNDSEWVSHEWTSTTSMSEDWAGGEVQLRLNFYTDDGTENESYEMLVDNVQLVQTP